MAGRVSRRQQISDRNNNVITVQKKVKITYKAGIYRRLSLLDGGHGKESESLENQELLIRDYLAEHPDIELVDIYTDNGETGTDFERSDFNRMMDDIKHKKINCVIVKDLSRFGRSYLEAEEYIEKIFPFLGIRFIAVLDNVDTFSPECKVDDIMRSMKNLMNEGYSRDLSSKIGSAFDTKRANGEMLYRTVPYGYKKSGDPMHPFLIDEEVAPVVRTIFEMYADGHSTTQIAEHFIKSGTLTPKQYFISKGKGKKNSKYGLWNIGMIINMLKNPVYLGHMYQGKSYKRYCDNQPIVRFPKEKWILYENVNEPIITQELWDRVQSRLPKKRYTAPIDCPERHKESLVLGLMYCEHCGKPMARRWRKKENHYVYVCRTHATCGNAGCINMKNVMEKEVESVVTTEIRSQLAILGKRIRSMNTQSISFNQHEEVDARIKAVEAELGRKKVALVTLFEQLSMGYISEPQYLQQKSLVENAITEKTITLAECIEEKTQLSKKQPTKEFITKVLQFDEQTEITKDLIFQLVERIGIDVDKKITVKLKYQDVFQELISRMESLEVEICTA